jgi:hypothetical protein
LPTLFILSKLAKVKLFKLLFMNNSCDLFKSQYKKAKETLDILEIQKAEINSKLESDFLSPNLHKDLRTINMDIRITENEIEHAESCIQECELKYNSLPN